MRSNLHSAAALLGLAFTAVHAGGCHVPATPAPDYNRPLPYGSPSLIPLGPGEPRPSVATAWIERSEVAVALERSLEWMRRKASAQHFPVQGIEHGLALESLERFAELLDTTRSPAEFDAAVQREFRWFRSAGWDGRGGGVLFTGYCTPILEGTLTRDPGYKHALYALPPDLEKAADGTILGRRTAYGELEPYPTRRVIEASSLLAGMNLELVWLRDPLDAFIAHVNGSAIVRLKEGGELRLGYAGKNGQPYTSLGAELVRDGHLRAEEVNLSLIRRWAAANPKLAADYMRRNDSFVFFTPIEDMPHGSLDVPVTAERTLATDKTIFPRGGIVFVDATLPMPGGGSMPFSQVLFDQDTGGAIRTAGRADIYLGVGPSAERMAGATRSEGQLYYLFLAPDSLPRD